MQGKPEEGAWPARKQQGDKVDETGTWTCPASHAEYGGPKAKQANSLATGVAVSAKAGH